MQSVLAKRLTSTILAIVISAIVLWWLLADGAGEALIDALGQASLWPLALGGMIAIAIQMIRAWRFAILASGSLALPSWTMIGIATKLVLLNFLLPFKLGELGFPVMMKRAYGTPFSRGAGILILCRLLDLGVVAAIILLTAAWLLDPAIHGWSPTLISLVGLAALLAPFLIPDLLPRLQRLTGRWQKLERLAEQTSHGACDDAPRQPAAPSGRGPDPVDLVRPCHHRLARGLGHRRRSRLLADGHGERVQQPRLRAADQRCRRPRPAPGRLGDHAASGGP